MKILYAIQGTGNGHIARAEEIIPALQKYGELDLFVSGAQADIQLPYEIKYQSKGLSFYFGKSGGIDLVKTVRKNNARKVYREIQEFPVQDYDIVLNDFEPISAWSCRNKGIKCISLSHQSALLSPETPKPKHYDPVGLWILKNYAPTANHVGFHFGAFDDNIFTPVIRKRVRESRVEDKGHYTVYLPAYDDKKLAALLLRFPKIRWHVFSKHTKKSFHVGRVSVYPINNEEFTASMASSSGVICGAGFETPAEALYLGKKLLVVPMKNQYEQFYNAAALKAMGVKTIRKVSKKRLNRIQDWIESDKVIHVTYPEVAATAVERALQIAGTI